MRSLRMTGAAAVVACLGVAGTSGASVSAQPVTVAVSAGHAVHLTLPAGMHGASAAAASSNNLVYNGGPVENAGSTNYAIFWEPPLQTSVSATYNSLISRFLTDIGGTSLYGVASQYYQTVGGVNQFIANKATFGGSWLDTSLYPGPALTDSEIQSEVSKAMAANGWTGGVGHEFFVFTGKNEIVCAGAECSNAVFCAYHSSFASGSSTVLYADQPYTNTLPTGCNAPTSPNGDPDADSTINVISHELMETVTDPEVGTPLNIAWQDTSGSEIGDKCNFMFGPTDAGGADLRLANGNGYIVQQEWSNAIAGCSMS
jgi:hypothetical protein